MLNTWCLTLPALNSRTSVLWPLISSSAPLVKRVMMLSACAASMSSI